MAEITEEKILEIIIASGQQGISISDIYEKLGIKPRSSKDKDTREEVKKLLDNLLSSHKIKKRNKRYYANEVKPATVKSNSQTQTSQQTFDLSSLEKEIEAIVKRAVLEAFKSYFGDSKSEKDFDRVYDEVKDSFGYARLEEIRKQLGMTEEQFYGKFRDYILKNYQLIDGGSEGILIHGSLYGIVKKR
ncbi:plasmid protein [Sulfolobus acidocaldarius SUSAZ]|nr:plasmid protein [Sulfolobus acidocaldarius SUSAZ]